MRKINGRKHSRLLTDLRNSRIYSSVDDSQYTVFVHSGRGLRDEKLVNQLIANMIHTQRK